MAEILDLLGVIETWVAAGFTMIALAGIIPAYILHRESQTDYYKALSLIDNRTHEYLSKCYDFLPGKRFFRLIKVPNLREPPTIGIGTLSLKQVVIRREYELLDRDRSYSLISWVNLANVLQAYSISLPRDGKLKISGTDCFLFIGARSFCSALWTTTAVAAIRDSLLMNSRILNRAPLALKRFMG